MAWGAIIDRIELHARSSLHHPLKSRESTRFRKQLICLRCLPEIFLRSFDAGQGSRCCRSGVVCSLGVCLLDRLRPSWSVSSFHQVNGLTSCILWLVQSGRRYSMSHHIRITAEAGTFSTDVAARSLCVHNPCGVMRRLGFEYTLICVCVCEYVCLCMCVCVCVCG